MPEPEAAKSAIRADVCARTHTRITKTAVCMTLNSSISQLPSSKKSGRGHIAVASLCLDTCVRGKSIKDPRRKRRGISVEGPLAVLV